MGRQNSCDVLRLIYCKGVLRMERKEVMLEKMTRREFRERLQRGDIKAAIIATGSIEQHLEHLAMEHDIASATYIAQQVAQKLYPKVVVTVPMNIGISEHWMWALGTLSAKPGSWLSVLFDAAESLVQHGVKNVLILNGHAGNSAPVKGVLRQWQLYFARMHPGSNVQFANYWDFLPKEFADEVLETKRFPGHAQEFETAIALYAFPENVRQDSIADQEDKEPSIATEEKGKRLVERAVEEVAKFVAAMIDGTVKMPTE